MGSKTFTERVNRKEKLKTELTAAPSFCGGRINIEITNSCNHACVFCPCKNLNRKHCSIDEDLFYRVAKEARELGIQDLGLQMLGEPLTNKNVAKYIRYAKEIGFPYVYLTTNGALATKEKVNEIFEAGLDSIKFSINAGSADSYLAVHGKDDFELVKQNLKYCREYQQSSEKEISIFVSCVLTDKTLSEIPTVKELFAPFCDEIAFYEIIERGGEIASEIRTYKSLPAVDTLCEYPFIGVYVTCEGFLAPCCMDGDLHYIMADLHNTKLADALYSPKMTAFRQMHINKTYGNTHCGKCIKSQSHKINIFPQTSE